MTSNERLVFGLLSGLLGVALLVWFWEPIAQAARTVFILLASVGLLVYYARWVYAERALRSWLAPALLLGCLLLAAGVKTAVYERAHTVSYVREERWISETVYYEPEYEGEELALALLLGGPLVGIGVLLLGVGPGQRGRQFFHYLVLLGMPYPVAALWFFAPIGAKPRYEQGESLPLVAGSLRVVGKESPYRIYLTQQ
ncbi:hypothetical protein ACFST9_19985 [Hymenobacter monticola]|uniref:Uncharacterized protein n=1 Tax=Hymenobacter monticola TaxID=1705399 RepID=A0ABY4B6W6_9BACT|nr:hypothetical protein [Hymenobacter monticola]UOE34614.1 hypothetical protein MTP16_02925 [Hymenobacter monticola]